MPAEGLSHLLARIAAPATEALGAEHLGVMLNKGPHILGAIRTLDDILKRMQAHQAKKRALLRALSAWSPHRETTT